jgi:REP element-mobilizing transposase RayT
MADAQKRFAGANLADIKNRMSAPAAIFFPPFPLTISSVMEAIKVGSTHRINAGRKESGLLWQPRFFDRAVRTVKEYYEKVEYIHLNPVRAGLVERAEDWP